ncbi:hypothetical protein ABPG72_022759 [Tetrahymena utriculariae]
MRLLAAFLLLTLTIANLSAQSSQKVDQYTNTAANAIPNICQQCDTGCPDALQKIGSCLTTCASGTNQSDAYVLNCVKTTCTTPNKTVQDWLNKFVKCIHLVNLSFSILLLTIFALAF